MELRTNNALRRFLPETVQFVREKLDVSYQTARDMLLRHDLAALEAARAYAAAVQSKAAAEQARIGALIEQYEQYKEYAQREEAAV